MLRYLIVICEQYSELLGEQNLCIWSVHYVTRHNPSGQELMTEKSENIKRVIVN